MLNKKNGLSEYRQKKIMWAFAVDLTATQTAHFLGLDRKTVNRYYGLFRTAIHAHQRQQIVALMGVVECDESFFGPERPRGFIGPRKRGRGTNKQPVFGIFERGGRVTSTALRASGPTPSAASRASIASRQISNSTSRNVSGVGARIPIRSLPNYAYCWSRALFKI